jgi:hypothetical protein
MNNDKIIYIGPIYFPDGRPAPLVLTEEEAAELLRLENGSQKSRFTLQNYRPKGVLRGTTNIFSYLPKISGISLNSETVKTKL